VTRHAEGARQRRSWLDADTSTQLAACPFPREIAHLGSSHCVTLPPPPGRPPRPQPLQDIFPNWPAMLRALDNGAAGLAQYAGPGGWNDPDMLEVRGERWGLP
jgi:hypothetical protein